MAVFNEEQRAGIAAGQLSLSRSNSISSEAQDLISSLRLIDEQPVVNGNADGDAIYAAALVKWAEIKARLVAAVAAL